MPISLVMIIGCDDECLNERKGKMTEWDAREPSGRLSGKMAKRDA